VDGATLMEGGRRRGGLTSKKSLGSCRGPKSAHLDVTHGLEGREHEHEAPAEGHDVEEAPVDAHPDALGPRPPAESEGAGEAAGRQGGLHSTYTRTTPGLHPDYTRTIADRRHGPELLFPRSWERGSGGWP
jgi:hypothetical protein